MTEAVYRLNEADWCAIAIAKDYAARITQEFRRSQRREQATQTEERVDLNISSRSKGVQAVVGTAEVPCQTDIQCAGEWEGATRVAKRNAELSRKAAAAARKSNSEGQDTPCVRKPTVPIKPGKTLKFLTEPPKPKGT